MGFFDISGETVKQAEAAANFLLIIPANAAHKTGGDAEWTEYGRIIEASSDTFEGEYDGKKMEILSLSVKVELMHHDESMNANVGSTFKSQLRINRYALQNGKSSPKGSPLKGQYTMSNMSIHRMKAIMKVAGVLPDTEDGGYSQSLLAECFPAADSFSGVPSPLVGTNPFWFIIRKHDSPSKKDSRTYTNYEIAQVIDQ